MTATGAAIFSPAGLTVTPWERAFFADADPWGFILFARNIDTPAQVQRLTADLRDAVGRDAIIMIDQEGGRVQRMGPPHWRGFLPPLDQAERADDPARSFWVRGRLIADDLRSVGIDANCAPTCDIASAETHPFLQNRCLGRDPQTVIRNARATADGTLAGGVLPIIKHMPGHGRANVDSHYDLPTADVALAEAAEWDFVPFKALSDLPMGMSAHIVFPEAGPAPATQNPRMIDIIRTEIGFDGLLMTDDISMQALSGSVAERSAASLAAGCDVILHCNGDGAEMQSIATVAGTMSPSAQKRADAAHDARKAPDDVDICELEAEFAAYFA